MKKPLELTAAEKKEAKKIAKVVTYGLVDLVSMAMESSDVVLWSEGSDERFIAEIYAQLKKQL